MPAAVSLQDERGFSLIEVLAAMLILTLGVLPLAALFAVAMQRMGASTPMLIGARKGARGDRKRPCRSRHRRGIVGDDPQCVGAAACFSTAPGRSRPRATTA